MSISSRHSLLSSAVIKKILVQTQVVLFVTVATALLLLLFLQLSYWLLTFVCLCFHNPGVPSFLYVDQFKSDVLLPLSNNPTHPFSCMISEFRHLIVFVEQTLMTLQFPLVFFLKGNFCFKCWELPQRKKFRLFLNMCSSCRQALHLKPCLSFLPDSSSLPILYGKIFLYLSCTIICKM